MVKLLKKNRRCYYSAVEKDGWIEVSRNTEPLIEGLKSSSHPLREINWWFCGHRRFELDLVDLLDRANRASRCIADIKSLDKYVVVCIKQLEKDYEEQDDFELFFSSPRCDDTSLPNKEIYEKYYKKPLEV